MEALIRFSHDLWGTPKFAAVVVLIFITLFKIARGRIDKHHQEKTSRISEMIAEIEKNSKPRYHFVIEQVFQNRFGILIDYPVIKAFMSSSTPTSDILKYIQGARYIEFSKQYDSKGYKGSLNKAKLNLRKLGYLLGYFVTSFIACAMVVVLPIVELSNNSDLAVYLFFMFSMFLLAYLFLDDSTRQKCAIDLVEKYEGKKLGKHGDHSI
ncbi:hypothetical protein [Vibrio parahaemolyticus]|uniref:Uncharacterized protein n=1 Tax=Vibrio parahaemolyticus TaxID=670 RepID=A0AA47L5F7_VIBPH|nr:hypothetical protein [Vibrio parahaemolyticus]MCX8778801.1 hypothetical protein [Vibrio parahaemolyticus]MEA5351996.1 hypothetical protein [Vibrio parahaemolyticus]ODY74986.1 hypothetical protein BBM29_13385 [Vibrio parahaemolyticus]WAT89006.1 hypothetical protein O1Q84_10025 [Vibrio parahaemolyticus]HCG9120792.1 hypothetical protein [Vibrio parahaemolyticus]